MVALLARLFKSFLEVVLPFWFNKADNAKTTIEHEKTPTKVSDINERDYAEWLRKHQSGKL